MANKRQEPTPSNGGKIDPALLASASETDPAILALTSIISRYNAAISSSHGLQFHNVDGTYLRDLYAALGWKRDLSIRDYREMYERGDIAQRLLHILPEETWGEGFELVEDPDPSIVTRFEQQFKDLYKRLDLADAFMRLDICSQIGRYAVMYVGIDGSNPSSPLPTNLRSADSILYLTVLEEDEARIADRVTDRKDPRYGRALTYNLSTTSLNGGPGLYEKVHHSRVIHVSERVRKNPEIGEPMLKPVFNRLYDTDKMLGGWAEAVWRRIDPGRQYDFPPDAEMTEAMANELDNQIDEFNHGFRRDLKTRGISIKEMGATGQLSPISQSFMLYVKMIAATYDIPVRRLIGSETGERSTTEDNKRWAARIRRRRIGFAENKFITPFLKILNDSGAMTVPEYMVSWPKQETLTELDKGDLLSKLSGANRDQMQATGQIIITPNEMRDEYLDLGPLEQPVSTNANTTNTTNATNGTTSDSLEPQE